MLVRRVSTTPRRSSASLVRPTVLLAWRKTAASIATLDTSWGRASVSHWSVAQVGGGRLTLISLATVREFNLPRLGSPKYKKSTWREASCLHHTACHPREKCLKIYHKLPLSLSPTQAQVDGIWQRWTQKKVFWLEKKKKPKPELHHHADWNIHEKYPK